MARYDYNEITEELNSKANVAKNDIFHFEYSDLKPIFGSYFQFCQENLSERCDKYNIQPAKLYFSNEYSVNAGAFSTADENPYYVVRIHMGTIVRLYNLFYDKNDLFEKVKELHHYNSLTETLKIPLGLLMFQLATMFTYYHELTHLIQKSSFLRLGLTEASVSENENYSVQKHILELDADLNAAHSICFHILEYWRKQEEEFQTQENLEKVLAMGIGSVLSYFLLLAPLNQNIYYKKLAHPHVFVRIAYIIDCFVGVAGINLRPEKNEKLDSNRIVKQGFTIADKFFKLVLQINRIETFTAQYFDEMDNIKSYANELLRLAKENPNLYMNRYKD